jgi:6-phospho-3-hexuloisomerase
MAPMKQLHLQMLDEFHENTRDVFKKLDEADLRKFTSLIMGAKKIYVLGIGHSGMFGKILAMKLNHVGLKAYTVFDEINPPLEKGDLFVAISQSGETSTIISLAQKAKKLGSKIAVVTSTGESTLGRLSDALLDIEKVSEKVSFEALAAIGDKKNQNLLGLLFGFYIYILFYATVIMIVREKGETPESINARHANLQ